MTEERSYYGQPVIKEPTWTPEIPWYFFAGGLGGASAGLACLANARGEDVLARRAWAVALGALGVSPALLISDLGRPSRFLNMLRMFKVTSPMSVGSWILSVAGASTGVAALHAWTGLLGGPARVARPVAAVAGLPLSTYTAALIAQTAVPVWHEARGELPFLFAAGAAASAGAAATVLTPCGAAAPARRLAIAGGVAELAVAQVMEQRLGRLKDAYEAPRPKRYKQAARVLTLAGVGTIAAGGRASRVAAVVGGALVLAGAASERFSVFRAGFASAKDPQQTIRPQRERVREQAAA